MSFSGQLELDIGGDPTPIGDLEPLADRFGHELIRLLEANGWRVIGPLRAFGGGSLLTARKGDSHVCATADTFTAAARALADRAVAKLGRLELHG